MEDERLYAEGGRLRVEEGQSFVEWVVLLEVDAWDWLKIVKEFWITNFCI